MNILSLNVLSRSLDSKIKIETTKEPIYKQNITTILYAFKSS